METAKSEPPSRPAVATSGAPRPMRRLGRDLGIAAALGVALYLLFGVFNVPVFRLFTPAQVLLLEAGAVVLVAWIVARALTHAASRVLARQGLVSRGAAVRLFINLLIAVGAVLALFRLAGVSADSIFVGAGFTGIVLGLAAQTVLANVFAGLLLVFADPFRPGDRVSLVSSNYGILAPTYPHEAIPPAYSGTVEDIGLVYTILRLDAGSLAKVPNAVVISALLLESKGPSVHRVRLTFPSSVSFQDVEAALPDIATEFPAPFAGAPPPRFEVADLGPSSWDGVVVLWTAVRDGSSVRDRVLRRLAPRLPGPAPAPGRRS